MTVYYVANAGSNSNSGTSTGSPWQTLAYAISNSVDGDTINLNGGDTFSENVSLTSGRLLQSYGTGQATIAGGTSPALTVTDCDGVTVTNLTLTMSSTTNSGNTYHGVIRCVRTGTTRLTSGVTISACNISGGHAGITFESASANAGGWNGIVIGGTSSALGNTITSCSEFGIYLYEVGATGTNLHYSNVLIQWNTVSGITGDTNSNCAGGCGIVLGNADSTTGTNAAQCVMKNNIVHDCGASANNGITAGPGGVFPIYSTGVLVQSNVVYNMSSNSGGYDGVGIDLDANCTNCIAERNYTCNCQGAGLLSFGSSSGSGNVFRWNISINDDTGGAQGSIRCAGSNASTVMHNNTVIRMSSGTCLTTANGDFFNNIFSVPLGSPAVQISTGGTVNMEGNAYGSAAEGFSASYGGTTYFSLAAWRTATGYENTPRGFANSNQFVLGGDMPTLNPSQLSTWNSYRLWSGSQLLSAGLDLNTLFSINPGTGDFQGNSISVPYSVGAINPVGTTTAWQNAVFTDNPAAWFRLDEASGTVMRDCLCSFGNGAYTNVTLNQPSLLSQDPSASASFNGTTSYAIATDPSAQTWQPASMSIEAWIKPADTSTNHSIADLWGTATQFLVEQEGTQILAAFHGSTGNYLVGTTTGANIASGSTYHTVVTWAASATTFAVYVNAASQSVSYSSQNTPSGVSIPTIYIGSRDDHATNLNNGILQHVILYPTVLSSARVTAHYDAATQATFVGDDNEEEATFTNTIAW